MCRSILNHEISTVYPLLLKSNAIRPPRVRVRVRVRARARARAGARDRDRARVRARLHQQFTINSGLLCTREPHL
jgi:hypothetical protein